MSEKKDPKVDKAKKEKDIEETVNEASQDTEKIVDLNTDEVEIEEPEKVVTPLDKALIEVEEYKNLAMRIQADFENYKKRNKEMSSQMYQTGISDAVLTVFPVLDSLELAINLFNTDKEKAGIELILRQFMTAFEKLGVKQIDAEGKEFNPEFHDAVMKCDIEGVESNKIVEVLRKGYMMKDKVIRPAMVKVSN